MRPCDWHCVHPPCGAIEQGPGLNPDHYPAPCDLFTRAHNRVLILINDTALFHATRADWLGFDTIRAGANLP
jgi:hypothetical protein